MRTRVALAAVTLLGLSLRLLGGWRAGLSYDEALTWCFALELGAPGPTLGADHPPLGHALLLASARLFGQSDLGLRALHLLVGAATVPLTYALGHRLAGPGAGLLAAALLAVDQYHLSWSRLAVEESPLLFLGALALLLHWRSQANGRAASAVGCGLAIGLAFLAKETAAVLLPAFAIGLCWSRGARDAVRARSAWLSLLAALCVMGAGVGWAWTRPGLGHLDRDRALLSRPTGPSLKGASLYVGELFRVVVPDALDTDYGQVPARAVFWPAGILYLAAVGAAVRSRDEKVRQLVALFAVPAAAASLADARKTFDPYWWGSLSLVAAVLLTARAGARLLEASSLVRRAAPWLLAGLLVYDLSWLHRRGEAAERLSRPEWARKLAADGEAQLQKGETDEALEQALLSLILDPSASGAHRLISRVHAAQGRDDDARRSLDRARALEAAPRPAPE